MLHILAGATIHVANLVNYNCHPQADGNNLVNSKVKEKITWILLKKAMSHPNSVKVTGALKVKVTLILMNSLKLVSDFVGSLHF